MTEQTRFTHEQRVALVSDAKQRMDSIARLWLDNPKIKAALLQPEAGHTGCKEAS